MLFSSHTVKRIKNRTDCYKSTENHPLSSTKSITVVIRSKTVRCRKYCSNWIRD